MGTKCKVRLPNLPMSLCSEDAYPCEQRVLGTESGNQGSLMKITKMHCLQWPVESFYSITKCTPEIKATLHLYLCSFARTLLGLNTNTHLKMKTSLSYAAFSIYSAFLKIASFTYLTTQLFNFISTAAFTPNQRAG